MSMTTPAPRVLVQHVRLKASAERVYKALTDPAELQKWFPERVSADPRVGGSLRFEFDKEVGGLHAIEGRFLALEPNQLVSYTWHEELEEGSTAQTNLTIVFRLVADGEFTDLYLEETGYGAGQAYETLFGKRSNGWGFFMGNIKSFLEDGVDRRYEEA